MDLKDYFDKTSGLGVLATADSDGLVDIAVYARPNLMEDGVVAFIMADRLSHKNLQTNPHAAYLFQAEGSGYEGIRLHLVKMSEEKNSEKIESLRRRCPADASYQTDKDCYLVLFKVDRIRPLVGDRFESQ